MTADEIERLLSAFRPPLTPEQVRVTATLLDALTERPTEQSPPARAITAGELADRLGVTTHRVLTWRAVHNWPCFKVGTTYRFTDDHVAAILALHNPAQAPSTKRRTRPPRRRHAT
jgi:hypothetical protein